MSDPVVDTQFTTGTVITADWLNGVNDFVNSFDGTYPACQTVTNIAALRIADKTRTQFLFAKGYYTAGDGGGGMYYYDSTDTTSADNGGTIIVAADGGRWKLSIPFYAVSVRQFGAKGDASTNDKPAIQAAIDAAGTTGGLVFFPKGEYVITSSLIIDDTQYNLHLSGVGFASQIQNRTGTSFDLIKWADPGGGNMALTNTVIEKLLLTQFGATGTGNLINTQFASNVTVQDCDFRDMAVTGSGVFVTGNGATYTHDINVRQCRGDSTTGHSFLRLTGTTADSRFSDLSFEGRFGVQYSIYSDDGSSHNQFENMHIGNNVQKVLRINSPAGGGSRFTNCIFDNCSDDVVILEGSQEDVFTNCTFMFAPLGKSNLIVRNANNNEFIGCSFESGGSTQQAFFEDGTSNNNVWNGYVLVGTFPTDIGIVGNDSYARRSGIDINMGGAVNMTAGVTRFVGNGIGQTSDTLAQIPISYNGYIKKLWIQSVNAPGAAQTYIATVRKNGVDTALTATISGAASFGATATNWLPVVEGDALSIKIVASAGAAASDVRVSTLISV